MLLYVTYITSFLSQLWSPPTSTIVMWLQPWSGTGKKSQYVLGKQISLSSRWVGRWVWWRAGRWCGRWGGRWGGRWTGWWVEQWTIRCTKRWGGWWFHLIALLLPYLSLFTLFVFVYCSSILGSVWVLIYYYYFLHFFSTAFWPETNTKRNVTRNCQQIMFNTFPTNQLLLLLFNNLNSVVWNQSSLSNWQCNDWLFWSLI